MRPCLASSSQTALGNSLGAVMPTMADLLPESGLFADAGFVVEAG